MNDWICAPRSTDHDPALDKKSAISVTSVILCGFIVLESIKIRNIRNVMPIYFFGINLIFVTVIILTGMVLWPQDGPRHDRAVLHSLCSLHFRGVRLAHLIFRANFLYDRSVCACAARACGM